MLKVLKWLGIGLVGLLLAGFIALKIMSKPLPTGEKGATADALAQKMLGAINQTAWDTTNIVQWTFFRGENHYVWDKKRHLVQLEWGTNKVLLNPNEISGKAWQDGVELEGDAADKLVKKAWANFCNDSFWLNAPSKVFDPGVERSALKTEEGDDALLVQYASGGVTPGDAYLWILDENGLPKAWRMWVGVLPLKGIENTWEDWQTLAGGAKIAKAHGAKGIKRIKAELKNIKAAQTFEELGIKKDPFEAILP